MESLPRIETRSVKDLHNNSGISHQTSSYRRLRNIKSHHNSEAIEIKNWMKKMVEKSLKLGHDLGYIKEMMIKSREKQRMEKNLLNIKKNIKIVKLRGRPKRRGLSNSYLKNSSMHNLTHNYSDFTLQNYSNVFLEHKPEHYISGVGSRHSKTHTDGQSPKIILNQIDEDPVETPGNLSFVKLDPIDKLKEKIKIADQLKEYIKKDMTLSIAGNKKRWKRIRKKLRLKLMEIKKMGVSLEEFLNEDIYPRRPFSRELSYDLIEAAKMGEFDMVKACLKENPFLVYDYDHIGLTAMHWACKRNNTEVGVYLLKNTKLNVESKDLLNRPALYYAVENKNIELVKGLLLKRANPWSSSLGYDYLDVCEKDVQIVYLIQKFRNTDMLMSLSSLEDRKGIWDRHTSDIVFNKNNDF